MIKILFIGLTSILSIARNIDIGVTNRSNFHSIQASKYEIVKKGKDNRGLTNQLYVYVPKMENIKSRNNILFNEYRKSGVASLQIYYFDDKQVARTYSTKVFDKNISDEELDRLGKHVTGKFVFIALSNTQSLHVGREADLY